MALSQGHICFTEIDIDELFQSVQELADQRLAPIHLTLQTAAGTILGDKELLMTCILNLLENAQKASKPDAEIKLLGSFTEDRYQIAVLDHGIGMPQEEIKRITENFYRIDKARSKNKGGYGIGLSLCARIAHLHHSELKFTSEPGRGTIVSLNLEVIKSETI